ncbi:MAG: efflux transporter outer membrane subunit [Robiginitomaculum sp.]|nr:efflux transporter outer membrane subunit [Robiginitomaculum sp.]
MRLLWVLLGSVSLLGACASVGDGKIMPSFSEVPASQIPELTPKNWSAEYKADAAMRHLSWVASFGDQKLEDLVTEALANNYNLEASSARLQQSLALAKISNSARLPSLSLGASGTGTAIPNAPNTESYSGNLTASWELDLWGRVRDRAKASANDAAAAQADFEALQLSVAGQTASAWIALISASQQAALAADDVTTRERSMGIVERRYNSGLSTSLDIRLARSALAGSRATVAFQKQQHANATRRLEILLGRYPAHEIKAIAVLPIISTLGPIASPEDVLIRRPDIRSAEQRLEASGLRVAEARKALLPSLILRGSASTNGGQVADIFDLNRVISSLVGSVTQPLFAGGSIKAGISRSEAAQREQLARYAQTVLIAWREVEDALSGEKYLLQREAALLISVAEAKEAERLAEREYVRGVGTIFELLDAQRRRISAEGQLITAASARASNRIALFLALGGSNEIIADNTAKTR